MNEASVEPKPAGQRSAAFKTWMWGPLGGW